MERHKKRKKYLDRKNPLRKFHNYFPEALKREKETVQASEYDWNVNTQRESRKKGKNERIGEYSPLMEQMRYLTFDGSTNSDKISVDFIGRYENLNQHFDDIVTKIGLPDDLKLKRTIGANQHKLPYCEFQSKAQEHHKCKGKHRKDKCRFCGSNNIHNQIGQLYNIWKANELKKQFEYENNFKYDLVVRTRFDNYFFNSLTDSLVEQVSNGSIWIPYGFDDLPEYGGGVNDQFAIGTSESMDIYSSMYTNMYDYCMKYALSEEGYGVPHRTILVAADENNISVERFWLKYTLMKKLDLYKKRTKGITEEQYKELRI
jgi:hypothetical protein